MNKWMLRLGILMLVIGVLAGCGANDSQQEESTEASQEQPAETQESEESVTITLSKDDGDEVITEEEVAIEEDAILMDVMEENFDIEHDGGFITSIDGIAPEEGEEKSWMFFVNGETAMVGAEELELSPDDEVTFDLQAWE
ncbi:DUF4430 domain-containing protein [Virgibacillus ainsalahensis]